MSAIKADEKGIILSCPQCGKKNRVPYGRLSDAAQCGSCGTEIPPPSQPIEIEGLGQFNAVVGSSALPVVVDYWAPWCGPCKMVAPELAKVAAANAGKYLVVKVNTEALPALGQRYRVQSIPTLAVFHQGREIKRDAGARPAPAIEAFIQDALKL